MIRYRSLLLIQLSISDLVYDQNVGACAAAQGDGFVAQVVAGLRRDCGDAQLQLMAGDVLLSAYDLPLADIACLTGESRVLCRV
jgi:hypothetical protein